MLFCVYMCILLCRSFCFELLLMSVFIVSLGSHALEVSAVCLFSPEM